MGFNVAAVTAQPTRFAARTRFFGASDPHTREARKSRDYSYKVSVQNVFKSSFWLSF